MLYFLSKQLLVQCCRACRSWHVVSPITVPIFVSTVSCCPVEFICIYYQSFIIDYDYKQSPEELFFISSLTDSKMLFAMFIPEGVFFFFAQGVKLSQFWFTSKNRAIKLFWILSSTSAPSSSTVFKVACSSSMNLSQFLNIREQSQLCLSWKCILFPGKNGMKEIFANMVLKELNISQACSLASTKDPTLQSWSDASHLIFTPPLTFQTLSQINLFTGSPVFHSTVWLCLIFPVDPAEVEIGLAAETGLLVNLGLWSLALAQTSGALRSDWCAFWPSPVLWPCSVASTIPLLTSSKFCPRG